MPAASPLPDALIAAPLAGPDWVPSALGPIEQPAAWTYDIDPATGVSRATYPGEINYGSGGPAGALGIANGGTGATTAPAALANLGAQPIAGVTNASNALAGQVGEYLSAIVNSPGLTLATGTALAVASLALTAGDWDVWGEIWFGGSSVTVSQLSANLSLTNGLGSLGNPLDNGSQVQAGFSGANTGISQVLALAPHRRSLSAAATIYLSAEATFTSGTATGWGKIAARRVR